MQAPIAKKVPKELNIHGDTRIDNYFWMNQREDPEVIDYLNEENAYGK
ncbi:MAG: oligopeptidase B, partial [Bacteroidia bacterium]